MAAVVSVAEVKTSKSPNILRILVDRGSIEIFLNEGVTVLTHSIIHELDDTKILFEGGDKAVIKSMEINEVTSSWE